MHAAKPMMMMVQFNPANQCNITPMNPECKYPNLVRWTPKPTESKGIKPLPIDLWYDRMGGSSEKSIMQYY